MNKLERYGNLLTWAIILLAAIWLAFIAIPQFIGRISKHEAAWANRGQAIEQLQDLPSEKVSNAD